MSVASADAALLSAARAYASLKMSQHASSPTPSSSNPLSSTPSTPTVPCSPKQMIHYSRAQLLALHDSPLCVRPPDLKPLAEWFGDCDFSSPPKPPAQHPIPHHNPTSNQRSAHLTSPDSHIQTPPQSATSLPLLGRSQPPARNPFANFGKFGAEEFNQNPFNSANVNGPNHSLNNPVKGPRRLIDRDGAPHIGKPDHLSNEGNRRRPNDPSFGSANKDRIENQRTIEDHQTSDVKPNNRRTLDRYVPDRDRDDDRLRNRERERERDTEREKTRRSSLNPRDGPAGDEHTNWRRSPSGAVGLQANNNKRTASDHHPTNSRADKDTQDTRDSSNREKAREKTLNNTTGGSHALNRNGNHQRSRETKENGDSYPPSSQHNASSTAPPASRSTPPVSPNATLSAHPPRRIKDGAWDSGQGKWEISKPAKGLQNQTGEAPSEADAIQTWKAEMKALEAKKKLAAAAAVNSSSAPDGTADRPLALQSPLEGEDGLVNSSTKDTHGFDLGSKSDFDPISDPSDTLKPVSDSPQKQFRFTTLMNSHSRNENGGANSHEIIENDPTVLPRASRFAKFFDHHKQDGTQSSTSLSQNEIYSDRDSPSKGTISPSADPENMARVLSMLQMSSKQQTSEPTPDHPTHSKPQSSGFQFNNKLGNSNPPQHSLHDHDLGGFVQSHNDSPPLSHAQALRAAASESRGLRMVDDNTLSQPNASNAFVQTMHESSASSLPGSRSLGVSTNQPFNLFSTINHPSHAKSPTEASSGALRNQVGLEPQMFQLQHMLNSVNNASNLGNIPAQQLAHERHSENQKLAFLTRQLHQQHMSPSHVINQVSGVNNLNSLMSLNPTSSASASMLLSNNRQALNQFDQHQQNALDYQRVPIVPSAPVVNGAPHGLQHLNSGTGPNGIFQLPPANVPHSSLNNLFLHQQAPAHHPAIIPPSVNFASPPAGQAAIGNGRQGSANFTHQGPQILPGLQHHPINHHQQLQLQQQQQLQRLQRQQGLPGGNFANHSAASSNMPFPFMGGPTNRGFGSGYGNVNGFGIVPMINNPNGTSASGPQQPQQPQVQQLPPSPLANTSGLPGLQPGSAGLSHPFQQHQLANLPPQSAPNSQAHSVHSQLDLMSLLNAGNQRRIGM